tara:strand:- start:139 stop:765 length:627 start_codon:yes stop_codon:yes gene_type:complete
MATISRTGITNSSTIETAHITNIIDALDGTAARDIDIPGTLAVTGISNLGVTRVSSTLDLTSTNSELLQRLVQINNDEAGSYNLSDYKSGTTFNIELGANSSNSITINLGDAAETHQEYNILFSPKAAGATAVLHLVNDGENVVYALNCNSNAGSTVSASGVGKASTAGAAEMGYSSIKITNITNVVDGKTHWQMKFWSNISALLAIS